MMVEMKATGIPRDSSLRLFWLCGVVAAGVLAAPAVVAGQSEPQQVMTATFTKDVAPILQRSCQRCHSPRGLAPMPLTSYEEVRPWARAIKLQTSLRTMPPWFIDKTIGIQQFKDDPSLSDKEIATIAAWVDGGAPLGDTADMPPPLHFPPAGAWTAGEPDLVVSSPVFTMRAVGADWHGPLEELLGREVKVPTGLTEDRYVKSVEVREFRPDDAASARAEDPFYFTVHHSVITVEREPSDEQAGGSRPGPTTDVFNREARLSYIYEVGQNAMIYPAEVGVKLPAGSHIIFPNTHVHSIGREVDVQIQVGLTFHPKGYTPKYDRGFVGLPVGGDRQIDIPGNTDNVRFDHFIALPQAIRMMTYEPHLHSTGKRMCQEAIYPNGVRETLNCANYNHNWVKAYVYEDDVAPLLPAGTILHLTGWYNNTATNPLVVDPRNWKGWGQRSTDDMFLLLSKFLPLSDEEFEAEVAMRNAKLHTATTTQGQQ